MMTIENAINKLIVRNRNFVTKKGVSDYSIESDEIINAVLKLYHDHKALKEKVKYKNKIFQLFDIDESDYQFPEVFLDFINNVKYELIIPLQMDHLVNRLKAIDIAIKSNYDELLFLEELIEYSDNKNVTAYAKEQLEKNELYEFREHTYEEILDIFRVKYLNNILKEMNYEQ